MNKRGISGVVVAILLILLAIVAVIIMWAAVRAILNKADGTEIGSLTLNFEIEKAEVIDGLKAEIKIKREPGQGEVVGVMLILKNDKDEEQKYESLGSLDELESKILEFNLEIANPNKVEVYPIDDNGNLGGLTDSRTIENIYNNLVSHYKFDTDASDSVNNNDGTLQEGVICNVQGKIGDSCYFDGVDDYVEVADDDSLDFGEQDFTIAVWINAILDNRQVRIINKRNNYIGYELYFNNNGEQNYNKIAMAMGDDVSFMSGVSDGDAEVVARDETWHHIAVVFDRAGIKYYIDGVYDGTRPEDPADGDISNDVQLLIGKYGELDIDYFSGALDELRIYNRALTGEEIDILAGS